MFGTIERGERRYKLKKLIAYGGYGSIYSTESVHGLPCVAKKMNQKHAVLEIEVIAAIHKVDTTFLAALMDYVCEQNHVMYIIMERLDYSLEKLMLWTLNVTASMGCRIAIQIIEAIKVLHAAGYLHRDIKPDNIMWSFKRSHLMLIDFNLAIKYRNEDGEMSQSPKMKCKATREFCPLSSHENQIFTRAGDLESAFYIVAKLFKRRLPWERGVDSIREERIMERKREARETEFFEDCPAFMMEMIRLIDLTPFDLQPDYHQLIALIEQEMETHGFSHADPYFWTTFPEYRMSSDDSEE